LGKRGPIKDVVASASKSNSLGIWRPLIGGESEISDDFFRRLHRHPNINI